MRRILLTSLVVLALAPAALAAPRATGDGTFAVRSGVGKVTVVGRGTIFGQIDNGWILVNDANPDDAIEAQVSGAERTVTRDEHVTVYKGKKIRFRLVGGKFSFTIKGTGIDFSAIGKGSAYLNGDIDAVDAGDYSISGSKWLPMPVVATTFSFPTGS